MKTLNVCDYMFRQPNSRAIAPLLQLGFLCYCWNKTPISVLLGNVRIIFFFFFGSHQEQLSLFIYNHYKTVRKTDEESWLSVIKLVIEGKLCDSESWK